MPAINKPHRFLSWAKRLDGRRWGIAFACYLVLGWGAHASDKPQRIVSLNLCVDQILIDLVEKERIAALSFLATNSAMSAVAERAKDYTRVRGATEGVLAHDPDLVIAGAYSTPATRSLLKRLGRRVEVVQQPATVEGVRDLIKKLADLVGEPERGRQMIATFDRTLRDVTKDLALPGVAAEGTPTALAIQVNNIVSMPNTLLDDAMAHAGLKNAAHDVNAARTGRVPLETLVKNPPDVLVLANSPADFQTVLADNLRHPALGKLMTSRPVVTLPMWSTLCGTPYVTTAIARLARARRTLKGPGARQ